MTKALLLAATVMVGAGAASAATVDFTDRATFNAGVSGSVEDFNNIPAFGSPAPSLTVDTFTVTQIGGNNGVQTNSFVNSRNPDFADGDVRLGVADRAVNELVFDQFAPGTSAFGLDIFSDVAGELGVTLVTGTGTSTRFVTVGQSSLNNPISSFVGLTDDNGILSVSFDFPDPSGNFSIPTVDNVFVGQIAPVPLPAAFSLLLIGLGGLGVVSRRARKT